MTIEREDVTQFTKNTSRVLNYFGDDGNSSDSIDKACAYTATQDGNVSYYCRFYRGKMFSPIGIDTNKKSKAEFKKVSKEVFDFYKDFLTTRSTSSLAYAERKHIDV
tara:strand:- start:1182 stop:1502 length:321 start_codon:yes stop_codon:yes gene_type:complete